MSIKKILVGAATTAVLLGATAMPAFAATVSDSANPNACFGQARAWYSEKGPNGVLTPNTNGTYISERKGTNPEKNAEYIALYCVAE